MRALISLFVALVFAIAVTPGSMAMPAPKDIQTMAGMACPGMVSPCCDHMKADQGRTTPSKSMGICLGMLSCYGMAAIHVEYFIPQPVKTEIAVTIIHQSVAGLTLQPDNPPPIA